MAPAKKFTAEQLKERKRLAEKNRRERRRNDPELKKDDQAKQHMRYAKRKEMGLKLLISEMSDRSKRVQRKMWKEQKRKSRARQKVGLVLETTSGPSSPSASQRLPTSSGTSRRRAGRKVVCRYRSKTARDLAKKKEENKKLTAALSKYRTRYHRVLKKLNRVSDSPNTKVNNILANSITPEGKDIVKKRLYTAEVVHRQLVDSVSKMNGQQKKTFIEMVGGGMIAKMRCLNAVGEYFSYKSFRTSQKNCKAISVGKVQRIKSYNIQLQVRKFLEDDENSRCCPGKKDFVIHKKRRFQKRYLNDTLKNLWRKYLRSNPHISYSTFCRFRPPHVIYASYRARDTCLCQRHENFRLLLVALKTHQVIDHPSVSNFINSLCCEEPSDECLQRKCRSCHLKVIKIHLFDGAMNFPYFQWTTINEERVIKGQAKSVKRVVKLKKVITLKKAVETMFDSVDQMLEHTLKVTHQSKIFSSLREPKHGELVVHVDFSENYMCKYANEPQSVHFGASRQQICLHTVVAYCGGVKKCFCTVSENLRHDARAIAAHLHPVLSQMLHSNPEVSTIHFISDSPSHQYRNRILFTIIGKFFPKTYPQIKTISWNYSESGHGKGPVDGVGGTLKRIADRVVAENKDVSDLESFLRTVKSAITNIHISVISNDDILKMDDNIPNDILIAPVRQTMKVRQVTYDTERGYLQFNRLSCLGCNLGQTCHHYSVSPAIKISRCKEASAVESCTAPLFTPVIEEGTWIAAVFEDSWYPGIVEEIQDQQAVVNFMNRSGPNNLFMWPANPDRQKIPMDGFLCKLQSPPVPVSSRLMKIQDYKYIEFLKNNVI